LWVEGVNSRGAGDAPQWAGFNMRFAPSSGYQTKPKSGKVPDAAHTAVGANSAGRPGVADCVQQCVGFETERTDSRQKGHATLKGVPSGSNDLSRLTGQLGHLTVKTWRICVKFSPQQRQIPSPKTRAGGRLGVFDDPETAGQRLPCGPRAFVAKPSGRAPGRRRLRPGHPSAIVGAVPE
jgi:hypothetical protein